MDGQYLIGQLNTVLRENSLSQFLPLRQAYDYLWKAAIQFVKKTRCMSADQTIYSVATQSTYDLLPDYMQLSLMDTYNRYFIQFNNGTSVNTIFWRDYNMIVYGNQTQSVALPFNFTINDKKGQVTNLTGLAGTDGDTLTDAAAPFSNVYPGDEVHNTTTGDYGLVVKVNSSSSVDTALFEDGTNPGSWSIGDAYIVVPQGRKQLILSPPPLASGSTMTVPSYIKRPDPVYTPYDSYPFDSQYSLALVYYAVWLAKYQDAEPQLGDAFYKYWDAQVREGIKDQGKGFNRFGYRVNKIKRSYDDRSYR